MNRNSFVPLLLLGAWIANLGTAGAQTSAERPQVLHVAVVQEVLNYGGQVRPSDAFERLDRLSGRRDRRFVQSLENAMRDTVATHFVRLGSVAESFGEFGLRVPGDSSADSWNEVNTDSVRLAQRSFVNLSSIDDDTRVDRRLDLSRVVAGDMVVVIHMGPPTQDCIAELASGSGRFTSCDVGSDGALGVKTLRVVRIGADAAAVRDLRMDLTPLLQGNNLFENESAHIAVLEAEVLMGLAREQLAAAGGFVERELSGARVLQPRSLVEPTWTRELKCFPSERLGRWAPLCIGEDGALVLETVLQERLPAHAEALRVLRDHIRQPGIESLSIKLICQESGGDTVETAVAANEGFASALAALVREVLGRQAQQACSVGLFFKGRTGNPGRLWMRMLAPIASVLSLRPDGASNVFTWELANCRTDESRTCTQSLVRLRIEVPPGAAESRCRSHHDRATCPLVELSISPRPNLGFHPTSIYGIDARHARIQNSAISRGIAFVGAQTLVFTQGSVSWDEIRDTEILEAAGAEEGLYVATRLASLGDNSGNRVSVVVEPRTSSGCWRAEPSNSAGLSYQRAAYRFSGADSPLRISIVAEVTDARVRSFIERNEVDVFASQDGVRLFDCRLTGNQLVCDTPLERGDRVPNLLVRNGPTRVCSVTP